MQATLPVGRHSSLRTWYRLSDRVTLRASKGRSRTELVEGVIPEPVLTRLETPHHVVPGLLGMSCGVLVGRTVAAADVAASGAAPEMKPPAVLREALDAANAARQNIRVDRVFWHVISPLATSLAPRDSAHQGVGR